MRSVTDDDDRRRQTASLALPSYIMCRGASNKQGRHLVGNDSCLEEACLYVIVCCKDDSAWMKNSTTVKAGVSSGEATELAVVIMSLEICISYMCSWAGVMVGLSD